MPLGRLPCPPPACATAAAQLTMPLADAAHFGRAAPLTRALPRARRQVDLAPRARSWARSPSAAPGSPACSKARTCCAPPPRCARWAPGSSATATASGVSTASASAGSPSPQDVLDLGNSGTGARLLMGARGDATPSPAFFTGDASLRRRPMAPRDRRRSTRIGARIRRAATAAGCRSR